LKSKNPSEEVIELDDEEMEEDEDEDSIQVKPKNIIGLVSFNNEIPTWVKSN
jgi:hypothetical protein